MVSLPYVSRNRDAVAKASPSILRRYATATTMVLFVIAAASGVMMFFHIDGHLLFKLHAYLGLVFVAAALLHVIRNRTAFAKVAKARRTGVLVGLAAVVTAGFIGSASLQHGGNPAFALARAAERAPLSAVAPVLGVKPADLVARLHAAGIGIADAGQSVVQLAAIQGTDARHLFAVVLRAARAGR